MSDLSGRSVDGDRNATRVVRSWLREDRHEDANRVLGAALDEVATTPQRRPPWSARRAPTMNKFLAIGLCAAAAVAILFAMPAFADDANSDDYDPRNARAASVTLTKDSYIDDALAAYAKDESEQQSSAEAPKKPAKKGYTIRHLTPERVQGRSAKR